jgi:hypothetical protein
MTSFLDRRGVFVACAVLTLLTATLVWHASLVVDGTRYFWLDDDQMVSMRYARNLAQGEGLVWNPGERVEGYTSVGWALVMAAVHLLPVSEAKTALVVKIVAWLLACCVVLLTDRLLRWFVPASGLARLCALLALILSGDLLFWSSNGFETPLLTVIFLATLLRLLRESDEQSSRAFTYLMIGLLPIARSDAYYLAAGLIVVALGSQTDWRPLLWKIPLAAAIPAVHVLLRHAYYGDWLPNTYYLKVAGIDNLFVRGTSYLKSFAAVYAMPLILAGAGIWWSGERRRWWIVAGALLAPAYVLLVGADMFPHFRFLAPWIPVLLVLATVAATQIGGSGTRAEQMLLSTILVTTAVWGVHGKQSLRAMISDNGMPRHSLVVGLMAARFTRPEASIAVFGAGTAPYFSNRYGIDLLGKTDPEVARLPGRAGAPTGHGKFDIDASLARHPDLLLTLWSADFAVPPGDDETFGAPRRDDSDYVVALMTAPRFLDEYRNNAIPLEPLLRATAVYVRAGSAELEDVHKWQLPRLGS